MKHYIKENLLAKSLQRMANEHNPVFLLFMEDNRLPFKPYNAFKKNDLEERQALYVRLASLIWNPDNLDKFVLVSSFIKNE